MSGRLIQLFADPPQRRRSNASAGRPRSAALRSAFADLNTGIRALLGLEPSHPEIVAELLGARGADTRERRDPTLRRVAHALLADASDVEGVGASAATGAERWRTIWQKRLEKQG